MLPDLRYALSQVAGHAVAEHNYHSTRLDRWVSLGTVCMVSTRPAHGFPGGPPTPPYGEQHTAAPEVVEVLTTPEPTLDPVENEGPRTPRRTTRPVTLLAVFTAVAVFAAYMWFTPSDSKLGDAASVPTPDQPAPEQTAAPTQSATPSSDPVSTPVAPGLGVFAAIDVADCSDLTEPIGASNDFQPGVAYNKGSGPDLVGSGIISTPSWTVALSDNTRRRDLLADPVPAAPSQLRGVVAGHIVLFAPFDPEKGSRFAVYRASSGELVWSAKLAPLVAPLSDQSRMYLVDTRSSVATKIAIIDPSVSRITACFAAAGKDQATPAPQPTPFSRTMVVDNGIAYVTYAGESGSVVQALSEGFTSDPLPLGPERFALHGVFSPQSTTDIPTLLMSSGSRDTLRFRGVKPFGPNGIVEVFSTSYSNIIATPAPKSWGASSDASKNLAVQKGTPVDVRDVLVGKSGALIAFGSETDSVQLLSMDANGKLLWSAAARAGVNDGWSESDGVYHLSVYLRGGTSPTPPSAAIVSASTGEVVSTAESLFSGAAIGLGTVAYTHLFNPSVASDARVSLYDAGKRVGAVTSREQTVDVLAAGTDVVLVYCESGAKRYLVAFPLPNASEKKVEPS